MPSPNSRRIGRLQKNPLPKYMICFSKMLLYFAKFSLTSYVVWQIMYTWQLKVSDAGKNGYAVRNDFLAASFQSNDGTEDSSA